MALAVPSWMRISRVIGRMPTTEMRPGSARIAEPGCFFVAASFQLAGLGQAGSLSPQSISRQAIRGLFMGPLAAHYDVDMSAVFEHGEMNVRQVCASGAAHGGH